ncbi:MAG: NYN domain-containing protein [Gammaproteobacteria bacterium]|nr:NYN domain-containing protein [Gammaproteobacteria bacterium]
MERNDEPRLAVLIDADNTTPKWAEAIFEEIATLGEASVRRIYGDFSGPQLRSWEKKLAGLALIPHQQFAYTKGKNSSDIALVIDAMDLMHTGRFDGFVLVSSDSDFARLASRLREQGLQVFGIGKTNTPEAFRKACKRFIFIENLLGDGEPLQEMEERARTEGAGSKPEGKVPIAQSGQAAASSDAPPAGPEKTDSSETVRKQPATKAVPLVIAAMRSHDDDWVPLSVIGSHVRAANPEFDPRTYGCAKLVDLLEKTGQFEVKRNEVPVRARRKRLQ